MQRFKRALCKAAGAIVRDGDERRYDIIRLCHLRTMSDDSGKFVYDPKNLRLAAQRRVEELEAIGLITATQDKSAAGEAAYKGTAARLAGFYLP